MGKMLFCSRVWGALLLVIVFACPGVSLAADFSADFTVSSQGQKEMTGRIYSQDDKMRMEYDQAGDKVVTISRPDKKVVWMVMVEEKMYMEQAHKEDPKMQKWTSGKEAEAKLMGTETVSGLPCKKYRVGEKEEYAWISERIDFPVKTQTPEGTMLLKNIKVGEVPGHLFEIPSGYQKFSMPMPGGAMPGGMVPGMPGMPKGRP